MDLVFSLAVLGTGTITHIFIVARSLTTNQRASQVRQTATIEVPSSTINVTFLAPLKKIS